MESPTLEHYNGVKRILRYLKGTKDFVLLYKKGDMRGDCLASATVILQVIVTIARAPRVVFSFLVEWQSAGHLRSRV